MQCEIIKSIIHRAAMEPPGPLGGADGIPEEGTEGTIC